MIKNFIAALGRGKETNKEATRKIANALLKRLKVEAPVGTYYDYDGGSYEGGGLRDSLKYSLSSGVRGGVFGLGSETTTATFEMAAHGKYTLPPGTMAHPIFPREKPLLKFYWPVIQAVVRSKGVEHPGYQGDPWDERAVDKTRDEMHSIWAEEFNRWRVSFAQRN